MVPINVVEQLTNSTDPRFVRLCGEQSDILLNSVISREHRVTGSFEREIIKGRKPLIVSSYRLHSSWIEVSAYSMGDF